MSIELISLVMFLSMLLLLLTGRQIYAVVGSVGTISALALWGAGAARMPFITGYAFMQYYALLAIPPFVFMGVILSKSGVADNLFNAIYLWMGHLRGGLGMGTIIICAIIACVAGGSAAGTVTAGTIALPSMLKRKYDKRLVTGLVNAGGALGFLIPPSAVLILYGIIARVSIGHLWMGALIPGVLLAIMYIIYIGVRCHFQPDLGPAVPPEVHVSWKEKFYALRFAVPPIALIFLVLGLLMLGVTTIIECAAMAAAGALVCAAINHRLTWKVISEALDESLAVSCMFLWILITALLFSAVYDGLGALHVIERLFTVLGLHGLQAVFLMQLSFMLMGAVLDDTAMLLIVAPLYIPLIPALGFSLVWFGVLYTINVEMAYLTPPFGYNLFIMKGIVPKDSGITIGDIYRSVIPFVGIQFLCLLVVMFFPSLALWLPGKIFPGQVVG